MKRLLFVLAMLAFPAIAQNFTGTVIQPILSQSTPYTNSAASQLIIGYATETGGTLITARRRGIRVICTTACYISVASPSTSATTATGIYLPAAEPFLMTTPGVKVVEVTATTAGTILITEY